MFKVLPMGPPQSGCATAARNRGDCIADQFQNNMCLAMPKGEVLGWTMWWKAGQVLALVQN